MSGPNRASVIGAGPNGLAAAVVLARAGLEVTVYDRNDSVGGGARSGQITLPGFTHDLGAAVHPMALASEFFRRFELTRRVEFLVPEISYVHPFDDGSAGVAYRDIDRTSQALGRDGRAWRALLGPLVENILAVAEFSGGPLLRVPKNPMTAARLMMRTLEQGSPLWNLRFKDAAAPAMLTGVAAHSAGTLPSIGSAGVALVLAAHAHAAGWPVPRGGTQAISDAMRDDIIAHGGTVRLSTAITDVRDLPAGGLVFFDTSARGLARIAARMLPTRYVRALERFTYGGGVSKVDFALSGPVPWTNGEARQAVTLHLGGTRGEVQASELRAARGQDPVKPYILVSQPSVMDETRAPAGKHVLWAYVHVPPGSGFDAREVVTSTIERLAPGFTDLIMAAESTTAGGIERLSPNFVGGDISSGDLSLRQLVARPTLSGSPWRTPGKGIYLCSSSTPPATGVHGLSGYHAATAALREHFSAGIPDLGV